MKIALLGYGKMGKAIEKMALGRGHQIVIKTSGKTPYNITTADIAIDFSTPESAFDNVSHCIAKGVPVVCGTTGWLDKYDAVIDLCRQKDGAFLYASNFSLGVNIFFELNGQLARMMKTLRAYHPSIEEVHHTQKKDTPSGTAITLAEGIIENSTRTAWQLDAEASETIIPISAKRIDNTPGTHSISYQSVTDEILIRHTAHNRDGFALGALVAAAWLLGKTGVYTIKEMLQDLK